MAIKTISVSIDKNLCDRTDKFVREQRGLGLVYDRSKAISEGLRLLMKSSESRVNFALAKYQEWLEAQK